MLRWIFGLAVAAVAASSVSAAFVVSAVPSVGPSPNGAGGGANVTTYNSNAIAGLRAGTDAGSVGSGSYYLPIPGTQLAGGNINNIDAIGGDVTGLWHNVVNAPGFAGHLGNFLHMGLAVTTTAGSTFQVGDVSFSGFTYAFGNTAGFNLASVVGGGNVYGATTLGGPLTQVTAGDVGVTNYAEMYYVGPGYSIDAAFGVDFTDAASLAALFPDPNTPQGLLTGSWTVSGTTGFGGVDVNGAPAPATLVLMGLGFVGTGLIRRFRKA